MAADAAQWKKYTFARWEVARIVSAIAIKELREGDSVQIVEFESQPTVAIPITKELSGVILALTAYNREVNKMLFYPRGGTNIAAGLQAALAGADKREKNITVIITDMWDKPGSYIFNALQADSSNQSGNKTNFKAFGDLGPVYVCIITDISAEKDAQEGCKNLSKSISKEYGFKWNDCHVVAFDGTYDPVLQWGNHLQKIL
jgi:hypothetical protein